jgi:thermostable 8-oxoguanine DNA glycosylase
MIKPNSITNYNRSEAELEEFLLFAILVAGKKAEMQAKKLDSFLFQSGLCNMTPFEAIEHLLKLGESRYYTIGNNPLVICMKSHKLGQYKRLYNAFKGILDFKGRLSSVTKEELESVKGIGSKTSRFFILHSRPNQKVAVLDTHILKWLGSVGYTNVPKQTPPKTKYHIWETHFLNEASNRNRNPAELDLEIWKSYAK